MANTTSANTEPARNARNKRGKQVSHKAEAASKAGAASKPKSAPKMAAGRERRREGAYLVLFGLEFGACGSAEDVSAAFGLADDLKAEFDADLTDTDTGFIVTTAEAAAAHAGEFVAFIDANSPRRKVARLPKAVLALLKLGMYELRYTRDTPQGVVLSECMRLCDAYSPDDKPFVNAMLSGFAKVAHLPPENATPAQDTPAQDTPAQDTPTQAVPEQVSPEQDDIY